MLQWDLWDGSLTRARGREAEAHLETAREEERKLRLALDFEVEQARLGIKEAAERLAVTDKIISQASESTDLTRARCFTPSRPARCAFLPFRRMAYGHPKRRVR